MPLFEEKKAEEREQLEDHVNKIKDIGKAGLREKERLVRRTKYLFNAEEAGKVRDSAIDKLGHEPSDIQKKNINVLEILAKTHPDLIEEKSGELSDKILFASSDMRVVNKASHLVKTMKENNLLKEKDFKNIVQGATNTITEKGSTTKGAKKLMNILALRNYLKRDHFEDGQLEELMRTLKEDTSGSRMAIISGKGPGPSTAGLLKKLKEIVEE